MAEPDLSKSYRKIDYRLRPAKHAERLMMCEAFRRLRFGAVSSYQYVGLGSVYFADFALFHKALGINRMFSIEGGGGDDRQRFLDNRPFANIDLLWGRTDTELSKIDFGLRTIAWLDYDGRLTRSVLDDVATVVAAISSGSLFSISVQCSPTPFDAAEPRATVDSYAKDFGGDCVDPAIDDASLVGWGTGAFFKSVIDAGIETALAARNGVRPWDQKIEYHQVFNFRYRDGAHMLTVGGLFLDRGQRHLLGQCAFDELDFIRFGADPFTIEVPQLTSRELRLLDIQMPLIGETRLVHGSMPSVEAARFARIYRYLPNYVTADFF